MNLEAIIAEKYRALGDDLDEGVRRRWAATEARALGRGGATRVSHATGISLPTIRKGLRELEKGTWLPPGRVRRGGGGRKPLSQLDATVARDLSRLVSPATRVKRELHAVADGLLSALRKGFLNEYAPLKSPHRK